MSHILWVIIYNSWLWYHFRLEAAARQVSGATSQLLVACKVKADPDSETMHRLDKAGYAVKKASEDLTKAAKDAREAKVAKEAKQAKEATQAKEAKQAK